MVKPSVLQTLPMTPELRTTLESMYEYYPLWEIEDQEAFFAEKGASIRAVVTLPATIVDEEFLQKLPNLEIVASNSVGLDAVDLDSCRKRSVAVTNTPDVLTDDTADTALALLLATMRQVPAAQRFLHEGKWTFTCPYPLTRKVSGKRVGVVGLGRIGAAIARRCEGFGCTIGYYSRSRKEEYPEYNYHSTVVDLAKASDILIVACALTKATTRIIDRQVLDALGPDGFVVNIARGAVIDEAELVKALQEGRLAGAGLDVFENEPHVPEALFIMDNVVVQPHVGSGTHETRKVMGDLVLANLEAHFSGKPLVTPAE